MGKGLPRSSGRGEASAQEIIKQSIVVKNIAVSVDGATGVGFGTAVIGDLPDGNILFLGAVSYMQFQGPTSADLSETWEGDYAVGTTATADATLTGTDVNLVASSAIGAATAELSPVTRGASADASNAVILDNTDGSLELNLNLIIDDAHIGADDLVVTVNGVLHIAYIVLGDD